MTFGIYSQGLTNYINLLFDFEFVKSSNSKNGTKILDYRQHLTIRRVDFINIHYK